MLEQLSPSQRMPPPTADLRHSTLPAPLTVRLSGPSLDACYLTQRVERLRTAYFRTCPEVCIERPQLVTRFHQELGLFNQKRIGILDKAQVYRRVLETRQPIIWHTEAKDKNGQRFTFQ